MHSIKKEKTTGMNAIDRALSLIDGARSIVIVTHINPDGDAVGSALALWFYLKDKGKEPVVYINGAIPFNMSFVKGIENIKNYETHGDDDLIESADLVIIADLNDCRRLRSLSGPIEASKAPKILIDHHIDTRVIADATIVDTETTSTGELVWNMMSKDRGFKLTPEIASCLYLAIMTDTGSFRFPGTDGDVHRIVARLLDAGADPVAIYENVYNNNPFRTMKLLGEAFSSMELYYNGKLCVMRINAGLFAKIGAVEDDVENFVEKTLSVQGVCIGMLFTEVAERSEVRVSFRSKENYNVRELAMQFGGGGHFHAAGARVTGKKFDEVVDEIIAAAATLLG